MQIRKVQTTFNIFPGQTVSKANGDGTFKLTTTLQMKFNKSDDGRTFRCIVQPQPGRGDKVTTDRRIFVRCKWSCCARNTPEERKFIVPLLVFAFVIRGILSAFPSMFLAISQGNLVGGSESQLSGCFRLFAQNFGS